MAWKKFVVASLSDNTNSFGLRGLVLIAEDGESWEVGANHLHVPRVDQTLTVVLDEEGNPNFGAVGFEIPRKLPDAPKPVVNEIWERSEVKRAEALGREMIRLFNLKIKANGRVDTDDGDKTPVGLGRTILRYVEETTF